MIRVLIPALALIGLAACQPAAPQSDLAQVEVTDAVCRPTPNGRDVTGCYLTLTASTNDRLVSVATPAAATAQVHEMKTEGGMMMMAELKDGLPLPAGEAVSLKPGGNHIMLMGVTAPLKAGDAVSLTLTFEHAAPLGVHAVVGQPAPAAGGHGGH
ncbi:MAG: copper chaperone PCu(A)C [Pseudomonadota bacterium]